MDKPREEGIYVARHDNNRVELVNVFYGSDHKDCDRLLAQSSGMSCGIQIDEPYWKDWTFYKIPTQEELDNIKGFVDSLTVIMRMAAEATSRKNS